MSNLRSHSVVEQKNDQMDLTAGTVVYESIEILPQEKSLSFIANMEIKQSKDFTSLSEFKNLNEELGPTKTGHVYENKETKQQFVVKNEKVRGTRGKMMLSQNAHLSAYIDEDLYYIKEQLTPLQVGLEKLAYDFYALCGVTVPDSMILSAVTFPKRHSNIYSFYSGWNIEKCVDTGEVVAETQKGIFKKINDNEEYETYYIASNKIPNFKTLDELLDIKSHLNASKLNQKRNEELATQKIKNKPIKGFFESLPVMAYLFDWDGLGHAMNNFGFVDKEDYYQFVKIDPGEVCFVTAPDGNLIEKYGFEDLAKTGSTILHQFNLYPADRLNFQKAFKSATYEQKLEGIKRVTSLTDLQISDTVKNSKASKLIPEDLQKNIIAEMIRRRNAFMNAFQKDLKLAENKNVDVSRSVVGAFR